MPVYFRKMVGTRWKTIEVTDAEIETVTREYFLSNLGLMERCLLNVSKMVEKSEKLKSLQLSTETRDKLAISLIDKMVTPLHFAIENYVENKLLKDADNL